MVLMRTSTVRSPRCRVVRPSCGTRRSATSMRPITLMRLSSGLTSASGSCRPWSRTPSMRWRTSRCSAVGCRCRSLAPAVTAANSRRSSSRTSGALPSLESRSRSAAASRRSMSSSSGDDNHPAVRVGVGLRRLRLGRGALVGGVDGQLQRLARAGHRAHRSAEPHADVPDHQRVAAVPHAEQLHAVLLAERQHPVVAREIAGDARQEVRRPRPAHRWSSTALRRSVGVGGGRCGGEVMRFHAFPAWTGWDASRAGNPGYGFPMAHPAVRLSFRAATLAPATPWSNSSRWC